MKVFLLTCFLFAATLVTFVSARRSNRGNASDSAEWFGLGVKAGKSKLPTMEKLQNEVDQLKVAEGRMSLLLGNISMLIQGHLEKSKEKLKIETTVLTTPVILITTSTQPPPPLPQPEEFLTSQPPADSPVPPPPECNAKSKESKEVVDSSVLNDQGGSQMVVKMMKSAFNAYQKYAWGDAVLRPISEKTIKNELKSNSGESIIASLSTLWVMNLTEEFKASRDWVEKSFAFASINRKEYTHKLVTNYLGGLLSAYALTADDLFLNKSVEVYNVLKSAYNENEMPAPHINPSKGPIKEQSYFLLSEVSPFVEHAYLSHLKDSEEYRFQVERIRNKLKNVQQKNGLYLNPVMSESEKPNLSELCAGGRDFYYNLLRSYLQSGGKLVEAIQQYNAAIEAIDKTTQFAVTSNGSVWVRTYNLTANTYDSHMEYESCYIGAMFTLGAQTFTDRCTPLARRQRQLAEETTKTCTQISQSTETKMGPLFMHPEMKSVYSKRYKLSPELAESYFVLWRTTGDIKWRKLALEMAEAIHENLHTPSGGYSTVQDAYKLGSLEDVQPSIFLSATLKYLYLTLADNVLPLNNWFFNSAGHPLPICGRHKNYPIEKCKYSTLV